MNHEVMDDTLSFQIEAARALDGDNEDSDFGDSGSDISATLLLDDEESRSGISSVLSAISDLRRQELEDSGLSSLEYGTNVAVVSEATTLGGGFVSAFEANSEIGTPLIDVEIVPNITALVDPIPSVGTFGDESTDHNIRAGRSVFEVRYIPVWGLSSICGRRPDMEDAVSIIPHFVEIPLQMLVNRPPNGLHSHVTHLPGHFFGVFDGHGGSEVSSYCRERIHSALIEELEAITATLSDGARNGSCEELWKRAFTKCFLKVDDEVGGKGRFQLPVARDNVGSTAIIALVCTSHIVVANCGDSRAVLCRGREVIPLSMDHKPNREDEYARVEAAGGRIIEWDGLRISGILAMSRSIGDQYLKPPVISDPEVMVVPRSGDDEFVILASDGLWDVMTNEEVCNVARRSIYLWYRNNPTGFGSERVEGIDAASQAAAAALTTLALQKGSGDNISIVVLDLKRQRKSRSKPRLG